jgi:four helix bundle protein
MSLAGMNANCGNGRRKDDELAERLLDFSVRMIQLVQAFPRTATGKHAGNQLLRSGTAPGANYEEARGTESQADFVHKLSIVLKELKESRYWLKVAHRVPLVKPHHLGTLLDECEELIAIIAKSIFTARRRKR